MTLINNKASGVETSFEHNARLIDGYLSENLSATLEELRERVWQTDGSEMSDEIHNRLKKLRKIRSALSVLKSRSRNEDARKFTYLISASFLKSAYRALTKTRNEDLVYATGPDDGERLCALTRMVTFDLAQQSVACAVPESTSQLRALLQLDENEERLLATLHSHPGTGPEQADPSGTDLSTQRGLERNGYPAIGVVFSRDGFARFYSVSRPFRVIVSGAGVKQVNDCLFQITDLKPQSLLAGRASTPRAMVRAIDTRAKALLSRRSK
jgi:hypothetical protein